jgi:hypothetical protein
MKDRRYFAHPKPTGLLKRKSSYKTYFMGTGLRQQKYLFRASTIKSVTGAFARFLRFACHLDDQSLTGNYFSVMREQKSF